MTCQTKVIKRTDFNVLQRQECGRLGVIAKQFAIRGGDRFGAVDDRTFPGLRELVARFARDPTACVKRMDDRDV